MAEMKKYLDTTALGALVDQIKAEDAKILAASKKYTDEAPFDAVGSGATAEANAKAHAEAKVKELADGQVKTNTEAIAKLNGDDTTEGSVAKAVKDAKDALQANIDAVDGIADQNAADIEVLEGKVAALEAGTYDDTEVRGLIKTNADAIDALEETHATDKASLEGAIALKADQTALDAVSGVANAAATKAEFDEAVEALEGEDARIEGLVTAEAERAADAEADLAERIKAVEDDYLVEADKTELQGKIDEKAAQTALDAEIERATGVEAGLQTQINTIMNNPDAEGAINSINEFTTYVAEHGTIADGMRADINKNKEDIATMDTAYKAADEELAGRLDDLEAIDHEAYVAADTALKNELNGEIAKKADATALAEAVEALEGADANQVERIAALEEKFTGEGSVTDIVDDAKQEAIDAAAQDATTKANKALEDANAYTDSEIDKVEATISTLQGVVDGKAAQADLNALAGRVTTAEGEIDTLQSEMDAVEALAAANKAAQEANAAAIALKASQEDLNAAVERITKNESDIVTINGALADKAEQDDLDAAIERIAKNETDIAANTSAINSFAPITAEEVNALFA